jgi:hypothetical protein
LSPPLGWLRSISATTSCVEGRAMAEWKAGKPIS